jgi:hypothetical protein
MLLGWREVGEVGEVGEEEEEQDKQMSQSRTGSPPLLEALMKNISKYIHNFTPLVHLWLTYMYAHVGMLVCTCSMPVCTRRSLQGVGNPPLHSLIFFQSRKRRGNTKRVHRIRKERL